MYKDREDGELAKSLTPEPRHSPSTEQNPEQGSQEIITGNCKEFYWPTAFVAMISILAVAAITITVVRRKGGHAIIFQEPSSTNNQGAQEKI